MKSSVQGRLSAVAAMAVAWPLLLSAQTNYSFENAQGFLNTYCRNCHHEKAAAGGFSVHRVNAQASLRNDATRWTKLTARVRNAEMPPKGAPAPGLDEREQFVEWVDTTLRVEACAAGLVPGPAMIRRLNRDEYAATIRDLFDLHMDTARMLPADGAGGEGFDNAAETLFLSPLHSEKYMEAARFIVDFAAKEHKSRAKIFVAQPGNGVTADKAARAIFQNLLPRAFRRPVEEAEVAPYLGLYQAARRQGMDFEPAVLYAVRGVLVSPLFLFRAEPPNMSPEVRPLEQYALASRLSYFLWGSMPDELLMDVAAAGRLQEPEVLKELVQRMIRNDRSLDFAERFVEQWLRTRELGSDKVPDAKLFPTYATDEDLRGDIRFQPILFFRELLIRNLSLLNLLDSRFTISTRNLTKHYDEKMTLRPAAASQQQWVELSDGSNRGGLLGMSAVLAVSSYPYRTSPVLRGTWVMDSILGTPPPPPPANVPPLEETKEGTAPRTVRERLTQHRANPVCASCHSRIDPLGFALENYDAIGRWRSEESGKSVDSTGELTDGTKIHGPAELKAALMERRDLFVRNLTGKLLGYALGRGLTLKDSCTVDNILAQLKANDYSAETLLEAIVLSVPFRYQAGRGVLQKEQKKP